MALLRVRVVSIFFSGSRFNQLEKSGSPWSRPGQRMTSTPASSIIVKYRRHIASYSLKGVQTHAGIYIMQNTIVGGMAAGGKNIKKNKT